MKFHVFYTDNLPGQIAVDHQACCSKIGIDVQYHRYPTPKDFHAIYRMHGDFMNEMMEKEEDDVVCFLDIDCLPFSFTLIDHCYQWARSKKSFVGNAQSHFARGNHIYAAASFLMVSKAAWVRLKKPYLSYFEDENTKLIDTAQKLSLVADQENMRYKLL